MHPFSSIDPNSARYAAAVTFPDPPVVAALPYRSPPDEAPEALAPFVVYDRGGVGTDWVLTDDAIAFGSPLVVQQYLTWRATWIHELELDPLTSVLVLADLFDGGSTAAEWGETWLRGRPVAIADPAALADLLREARDEVSDRSATGLGFVNATPGRSTVGLARAWSPAGGSHLLAASDEVRVTVDRASGVSVRRDDPDTGRTVETVEWVHEVVVDDDGVDVLAESGRMELDHVQGRPLAWIVPGSTRWKVREVPEVLVWAKTFHRLALACELAERDRAPLELRVGFPVASTDVDVELPPD